MAPVSPTSVNCFSESARQWTCPSRKGVPGRNLTERGSIPIVNKLTMTICQERPLAAHTSSEGIFKSSVLLLHPNVAEKIEQEASMEDVQQC